MRTTWNADTPVDPTNLGKMVQDDDLRPVASTFNGQAGRTITHNYGHTNYHVIINPTADPNGFLQRRLHQAVVDGECDCSRRRGPPGRRHGATDPG